MLRSMELFVPKGVSERLRTRAKFFLFFFGKMAVSVEINEVVCPTRGVGQGWDSGTKAKVPLLNVRACGSV